MAQPMATAETPQARKALALSVPGAKDGCGLATMNPEWIEVKACPACGCGESEAKVSLAGEAYTFGGKQIPYSPGGISIKTCPACRLAYKDVVPSPEFQSETFLELAGQIWTEPYDFRPESKILGQWIGKDSFDLLDVGASNGGFLKACSGFKGRRSALDVVKHPGLNQHLRGEFIQGLIDDPDHDWSERPYDAASLFDIVEHLYDPPIAFKNLNGFLKPGGIAVIETGDAESRWPRKYGIGAWWYARVFPHHVFWTRKASEKLARAHGFEIVDWTVKRHKASLVAPKRLIASAAIKSCLYGLSPGAYGQLARKLNKDGAQPKSPLAADHFRAVLRKKE